MAADEDEPEEIASRKKSVHALSCYLAAALKHGARLEMYLFWEGDQKAMPETKKSVTAKDFIGLGFPLAEKEFANVVT